VIHRNRSMILPGLYRANGMGGGLGIDSIVKGRGGRPIGLGSVFVLVRVIMPYR
jgi:hypothetical protein